jgi:hypothetical protein
MTRYVQRCRKQATEREYLQGSVSMYALDQKLVGIYERLPRAKPRRRLCGR